MFQIRLENNLPITGLTSYQVFYGQVVDKIESATFSLQFKGNGYYQTSESTGVTIDDNGAIQWRLVGRLYLDSSGNVAKVESIDKVAMRKLNQRGFLRSDLPRHSMKKRPETLTSRKTKQKISWGNDSSMPSVSVPQSRKREKGHRWIQLQKDEFHRLTVIERWHDGTLLRQTTVGCIEYSEGKYWLRSLTTDSTLYNRARLWLNGLSVKTLEESFEFSTDVSHRKAKAKKALSGKKERAERKRNRELIASTKIEANVPNQHQACNLVDVAQQKDWLTPMKGVDDCLTYQSESIAQLMYHGTQYNGKAD